MDDAILPVSADEGNELFAAIGFALAKWTKVELNVNLMFGVLSRISDTRRIGAITDGIVSFTVRLSLCDRLIELEDFPELEKEMWCRLSAKVLKFYKKRHEIAHFNVIAQPREGRLAQPMLSPFLSYEKWMLQTAKYLSTSQVTERGNTFEQISLALNWFLGFVVHLIQPEICPTLNPEEPALIPHIRASALLILEERKRSSK